MIGIICVIFIAATVFALHKGKKGSAISKWRIPVGCIALGALGLLWAFVMYQRQATANGVLRAWTKTEGVVTGIERLESRGRRGRVKHTSRATVAFVGSDGKRKEGLLFQEAQAQGSRITIYYDPQKVYSPGAPIYNGARQLQSPHSTESDSGMDVFLIGAIALLGGVGLCAFGSYRVISLARDALVRKIPGRS